MLWTALAWAISLAKKLIPWSARPAWYWDSWILEYSINTSTKLNLQSCGLYLLSYMNVNIELCTKGTSNIRKKILMCTLHSTFMCPTWKSISIESLLIKAQMKWAGHVIIMDHCCMPYHLLYSVLDSEKRPWGWPHKSHKDAVKEILCQFDISQRN